MGGGEGRETKHFHKEKKQCLVTRKQTGAPSLKKGGGAGSAPPFLQIRGTYTMGASLSHEIDLIEHFCKI